MQLEASVYTVDKTTGNYSNNLIDYLKSKSIISDISGEENKWLINVTTLLGSNQSMGKGTYPNDVYVLEKQDTSTGSIVNTKVATTMPIKIATTSTNQATYTIKYYGNTTSENLTLGSVFDDNSQVVAEDPFAVRYEYGYLWADFKDGALRNPDSLTEQEKQKVLNNYFILTREDLEKDGLSEEEIDNQINQAQNTISSFSDEQKNAIISNLIYNAFEVNPDGAEEYSWNHKYNRMLIGESGEYTVTYMDLLSDTPKKTIKKINIQNLEPYVIDLGTDYNYRSYWISIKHFENNEYKTVYADRVIFKLDGVEMFNGVPPELVYWYFEQMNENIEENKEYMADITAYFGDTEVNFKGKITVGFPS